MRQRKPKRAQIFIAVVLLVALVAGCAAPPEPGLPPAPKPAPVTYPPVTFPKDEGPHNDLTEWWYYTGHLEAEDGRQWGFEQVVFQILRGSLPAMYVSHIAVTDHTRKQFRYAEQVSQGAQVQPSAGFAFDVQGLRMSGLGGSDRLSATVDQYVTDLSLTATKPPVLHDGGLVTFGPAGDSYYYSRTRVAVTGTIVDHGEAVPVRGLAWFDKQWGNFLVMGGGWDWFSLHLDDGSDLMLNLIKDAAGRTHIAYGTLVAPDGQSTHLPAGSFEVAPLGNWISPHTGISWPSGWRATVTGHALDLTITPVIQDQELDTRRSTGLVYWEGAQTVTGTRAGQPMTGQAYVELVGYGS